MVSKQNNCLIVESDKSALKILSQAVLRCGYETVCSENLSLEWQGDDEPDTILIGAGVSLQIFDQDYSDIELLIREYHIPVLAPVELRERLLERFEEVHIYKSFEMAEQMLPILVTNYSKRRRIRNDMVATVSGLSHVRSARFSFQNIAEAEALALLIASIAPHRKLLRLGLTELFVNAVEHGNLNISAHEKEELRKKGMWLEEVEKRLKSERYEHKIVKIHIEKDAEAVRLRIEDQGDGFDWETALNRKMSHIGAMKSGRGLLIVQKSGLENLSYQGKGNIVEVSFLLDSERGGNG